jgi:hypothetical protein
MILRRAYPMAPVTLKFVLTKTWCGPADLALGGAISVRSPKGEGTAVEVALPLDRDRPAADSSTTRRLHT